MSRNFSSEKDFKASETPQNSGDYQKQSDILLEAAGLAHDLNNVLATISGYAELIREDLPAGSSLKDDAGRILSGVMRARMITEELLTLGKYSGHEQQETDAADMLTETIDFMVSVKPANILVEKDIPGIRALVVCEPLKLFRIFMNLIKNAFQSMDKNGGKLTAGIYLPSPDQIENMYFSIKNKISADENMFYNMFSKKSTVVIYFRDTGSGIDSSVIERIYDPYFTTRHASGGSGLGLSVVRKIITEMNGEILVTSSSGDGTEFKILLPLAC